MIFSCVHGLLFGLRSVRCHGGKKQRPLRKVVNGGGTTAFVDRDLFVNDIWRIGEGSEIQPDDRISGMIG